jgi:hypothetical protein
MRVLVDDLYLHIKLMLGCAHEQKAHGGAVDRRGNKNAAFATRLGLTNRFEA